MRKDEIIQKLARLGGNPQVVILDSDRNGRDVVGQSTPDGSTEGIHTDFDIRILAGEELAKGCKPVIALVFATHPEPSLVNALERLFKIEKTGFFHFICNSGRPSEQITQPLIDVLNDLRKFLPNG